MAKRPETIYAFLIPSLMAQGNDDVILTGVRPIWDDEEDGWQETEPSIAILDLWLFEQLFGVQLRDDKTLLAFDGKTLVQTERNEAR